jgi:hypothetical protein
MFRPEGEMDQGVVRYTEIKPAERCRFDAVALGEVMFRFDPFDTCTGEIDAGVSGEAKPMSHVD